MIPTLTDGGVHPQYPGRANGTRATLELAGRVGYRLMRRGVSAKGYPPTLKRQLHAEHPTVPPQAKLKRNRQPEGNGLAAGPADGESQSGPEQQKPRLSPGLRG